MKYFLQDGLPYRMSTVYKMMIHPLLKTSLRGLIWYQGNTYTITMTIIVGFHMTSIVVTLGESVGFQATLTRKEAFLSPPRSSNTIVFSSRPCTSGGLYGSMQVEIAVKLTRWLCLWASYRCGTRSSLSFHLAFCICFPYVCTHCHWVLIIKWCQLEIIKFLS